jgi:hypothetical protein
MAKRLQVIIQDPEYRVVQRMARSHHRSIAQRVREALKLARRREPDEVLLYEDRLSRPERRRILGLNRYGRKIEKLMDALLKL